MLERVSHNCSCNRELNYIEAMRRILLFQKTIFSKLLFVFRPVSVYHLLAVFLEIPIFCFITDRCVWFKLVASLYLVSEGRHQSPINIRANLIISRRALPHLLKGCRVIMMEETLLMFVWSFSISFTETIGARDLNCLSSCLVKENILVLPISFPF